MAVLKFSLLRKPPAIRFIDMILLLIPPGNGIGYPMSTVSYDIVDSFFLTSLRVSSWAQVWCELIRLDCEYSTCWTANASCDDAEVSFIRTEINECASRLQMAFKSPAHCRFKNATIRKRDSK
ncbi:MAG: hypothetical protein U0930_12700 [Pirellulales bacterium]